MSEHFKTFLLGLFVIIACASVVMALLFLRPSVGDEGQTLVVRFTNISGVNIGTRVTFAGKPVGEVVDIREIPHAREQPVDSSGHAYYYELVLAVDSHIKVYDTDVVAIHTTGLLGEKSVSIMPSILNREHPAHLAQGEIMYGSSGDAVDELVDQLSSIGAKATTALDSINQLIEANATEIHQTIISIHEAATHFDTLVQDANQLGLVPAMESAATHIASFSQKADAIAADLEAAEFGKNLGSIADSLSSVLFAIDQPDALKSTIENLASVTQGIKDSLPDLQTTLQNARTLSTALADGKSTLGKLMVNDDLYEQLSVILSRVDLLMSDINNYGILFHMNKGWQRLRSSRATSLENLSSPSDYMTYFQTEIDQINLALQRLCSLLEQGETSLSTDTLQTFRDALSNLQSRLQTLEEMIKNPQVPKTP